MWKSVKGYEGLYEVSDLGRIKSLERNDARGHKIKERIMKHKYCKGYATINLCKGGVKKTFRINQLVAIAFIPNPFKLPKVNHKDEKKLNNKAFNLEWCTQKYNNNYGTKIERQKKNTDYKALAEKLKTKNTKRVYQYSLELKLVQDWPSIRECCRHGYDRGALNRCFCRKVNTHKGYIFSLNKLEAKEVN